jgi:arylsulfatase
MPSRNVLVVLCDQLRADFLSAYGCGAIPTPNIDRLAGAGIVFENAITQSTVCAPARATMMTGRYVSNHGVWTNDVPFRDGLEYLPKRMNEAGYATGAFGKLHHYPPHDAKGFRETDLMEEGRLGESEPYLQWLRSRRPDVKGIWNYDDYIFAFDEEEYHEHWIASRAIEFIERRADDGPLLCLGLFSRATRPTRSASGRERDGRYRTKDGTESALFHLIPNL